MSITLLFSLEIKGQNGNNIEIVQTIIDLNSLQDLKDIMVYKLGIPDSESINDQMEDTFNLGYNLGEENFSLQIITYKRNYILSALLIYPKRFSDRISGYLSKLNYREGKYYKPNSRLYYELYTSTDKVKEEFGILVVLEGLEK